MPSSRGSSQSGIELRSPALQVDSLPAATREALTYVYPTLNIIRESLMKCISIWWQCLTVDSGYVSAVESMKDFHMIPYAFLSYYNISNNGWEKIFFKKSEQYV